MIGITPKDSHSNPEFPDEAYTLERRRKRSVHAYHKESEFSPCAVR